MLTALLAFGEMAKYADPHVETSAIAYLTHLCNSKGTYSYPTHQSQPP